MCKPIYTFCHKTTTLEEKMEIFIKHSSEFRTVNDKSSSEEIGRAYKKFEKRMVEENKLFQATHPRLGSMFPELRKMKFAK